MLLKNDGFKIVTSGRRHPSCPNLTPETKYFILFGFGCQMRAQALVCDGGGNMGTGSNKQAAPGGRIGQGVDLMAAADTERSAALQKKVDVAAELGSELAEKLERNRAAGKDRQGQQDRRGIAGSTAQAGAHGDLFGEPDLDSAGDAHRIQREPRRTDHEVIGNGGRVFDFNKGLWLRCERQFHSIGEGNGLKDGAELVVAVRPLAENAQIQVDFRQRAEAGAPSPNGLAHLSYCRSENTS